MPDSISAPKAIPGTQLIQSSQIHHLVKILSHNKLATETALDLH